MNDAFGRRWSKFVGLQRPPTVQLRSFDTAEYTASRLQWPQTVDGNPVRFDRADGYLLCMQRRDLPPNPYWVDCRPVPLTALPKGQSLLLNLHEEHAALIRGTVDCVSIFASATTLQRFREEHDLGVGGSLRAPVGAPLDDWIVRNLSECLLPAIDQPSSANKLFIDYVGLALLTHLCQSYGGLELVKRPIRGGLAPWQERRAKELLLTHLDGEIGLDELAAACQLSRNHFARAFKVSTGASPLRWLTLQRIERAKQLLLNASADDLSVTDIALAVGFQTHSAFTAAFRRLVGMTPTEFRRSR